MLAHHRARFGLAVVAGVEAEGAAGVRGALKVATLQATGPDDSVEALRLALSALVELQEASREEHAALGRRFQALARRLKEVEVDFDTNLQRTENLVRQNRRLATAAITDPLTGLLNRRAVELRLRELEELAVGVSTPVSVIMCDIDHFKGVNDTYGHLIGDAVLAQVARVLRARCRLSDTVGRWGGEEFVIVLPSCPIEPATRIAEGLRDQIESHRFHTPEARFSVTASFGVAGAELGAGGPPIHSLVAQADRRLYLAKEGGRNRVVSAVEVPEGGA